MVSSRSLMTSALMSRFGPVVRSLLNFSLALRNTSMMWPMLPSLCFDVPSFAASAFVCSIASSSSDSVRSNGDICLCLGFVGAPGGLPGRVLGLGGVRHVIPLDARQLASLSSFSVFDGSLSTAMASLMHLTPAFVAEAVSKGVVPAFCFPVAGWSVIVPSIVFRKSTKIMLLLLSFCKILLCTPSRNRLWKKFVNLRNQQIQMELNHVLIGFVADHPISCFSWD